MASVPSLPIKSEKKVEVLVAKRDLVPGSFVLKEKLAWQEWPEDALSDHMLQKGNVTMDDFVGSVIRARIPAGQPVLPSAMVKSGEQGFMAAVLAPGMRAVTVPLSATTGVGGFVFPGDKVDLLLNITLKPEGDNSPLKRNFHFTETLLKDIRVIGKDQVAAQVEGEVKVAKSATLEVTPKQAEKIALATQVGKLSLSLRSLAEEEIVMSEDLSSLPDVERDLKQRISFEKEGAHPLVPALEDDDDLSLTTDLEVNYFWRKMTNYRQAMGPISGNGSTSKKVQVHRGSNSTTQEFK